ncbi:hypothetical protein LI951_03355 [Enterococcus sp. BWT-B8]|uniref:hypothetical protein n=1 Tax=Enterococcus sp. BWT-B8 TaxID=2885157 RepID=UPI001E485171|nr:hypothetical protein [Enterococcus sp. BWT-B8]MCB5951096.1 hypothetical protein [Enterococcus sp. BWT-B8]
MNSLKVFLGNYWFFKQTKIASKVNGLLYYLKKLPFLGKHIPIEIYKSYGIKEGIAILVLIFDYLNSFLAKFVWLGMYLGFAYLVRTFIFGEPSATFFDVQTMNLGLFFWFVFVPIFLGFYIGYSFTAEKPLVDFIEQFGLARTTVVRGNMLLNTAIQMIAYIPAALVYGFILGNPLAILFFIILSYAGLNYAFRYLGRIIFTWNLSKRVRLILGTIAAFVILGFTVIFVWIRLFEMLIPFLTSMIGNSLFLIFLIIVLYQLLYFKKENEYLLYWINQATISLEKIAEQASDRNSYVGEGLAMQKKLTMTATSQFEHLKGNEYLNALLFSRYRSILNKALRFRFYFIGAAWVLAMIASFAGLFKQVTAHEMTATLPILFFLMYLMTFGKKVVQMVFVNCDVSMLYYPFYRESGTILRGFNYRFSQTFYYNGILSLGIFSVYLLLSAMNQFFLTWEFFGVLILLLVSLSLLFSFHELFVYYLLQPFTGDMAISNPLYKIIAGIFYGVSYMNTQLQVTGFYYALVVSGLSLLYVGIGFIVIYKKAPQTFRIKS